MKTLIIIGFILLALLITALLYACLYVSGDDQPNEEYDNFKDWEIF